jgi:FkbM family methyltransferase
MIYNSLADDISKSFFWGRLQTSMMNNNGPLFNVLIHENKKKNRQKKNILDLLYDNCQQKNDSLILYGNSDNFIYMAESFLQTLTYMGIKIDYFCRGDMDYKLKYLFDIPVITEDELFNKCQKSKVVIYSYDPIGEIQKNYLIGKGIAQNNIYKVVEYLEPEYFDKDIMIPHDYEIFIDGGVLDFKTSIEFIEWCNGKFDKIYAFEPDKASYDICKNVLQTNKILDQKRIKLYQAGLWNKTKKVFFNPIGNGASRIAEGGTSQIETVSIDERLKGQSVTFIKLDIEGAELEALKGARKTIKKYRPRLAVCIYHKPEDILEIPRYILSLNMDYKLYIRHYSTHQYDTVLLCV